MTTKSDPAKLPNMEFNSLPLIVQLEIFSYLSVRTVMKIRLVCKQMMRLIDGEFKFKRLRCRQYRWPEERCWFRYDFNFRPTSFLRQLSANRKFSQVKNLKVHLCRNYRSDAFNFLNSFKSLEELSFACLVQSRETPENKPIVVRLDRLKKAIISLGFSTQPNVLLDLPSLLCLEMQSLNEVTIKYPETLRTLVIERLSRDYSQFTSLTRFGTASSNVREISASFIKQLPSLRELHLENSGLPFVGSHVFKEPPLPKLSSSDKASPKIFYYGFEFNLNQIRLEANQWPLGFSYSPSEASTEFIIQNRHRSVDHNPSVKCILYNPMASELDDSELFGVMLQKFSAIDRLHINGTVADENRLLRFISQFKVKRLEIEGASLSQPFFLKLAKRFSFIQTLEIKNEPTMNLMTGDYDFIFDFKLKNLTSVSLDCPLSVNFLNRLLSKLKRLKGIYLVQAGNYELYLNLGDKFTEQKILLDVAGFGRYSDNKISPRGIRNLVKVSEHRLGTRRLTCPKELLLLLRYRSVAVATARRAKGFVYDAQARL